MKCVKNFTHFYSFKNNLVVSLTIDKYENVCVIVFPTRAKQLLHIINYILLIAHTKIKSRKNRMFTIACCYLIPSFIALMRK